LVVLAVAAALVPLAGSAVAGIADPQASTLDPSLVACPAGDMVFTVITRHIDMVPWAEGPVTLRFCDCAGFHLEPRAALYTIDGDGCSISEVPDGNGVSRFPVVGGGTCGDLVRIDAGGVPLGYRPVASPDQDGDLVVTNADLALIQSKLGTNDPTADFDGDGAVTAADLTIAQAHLGHSAAATGVGPGPGPSGALRFSRPPSPNPARGAVAFAVLVPQEQRVEVTIADLTGRRVATLWSGALPAGEHLFAWKGDTSRGGAARSGLYLAQLRAGDVAVAKLFALLR
jgi:hypothetical protein